MPINIFTKSKKNSKRLYSYLTLEQFFGQKCAVYVWKHNAATKLSHQLEPCIPNNISDAKTLLFGLNLALFLKV